MRRAQERSSEAGRSAVHVRWRRKQLEFELLEEDAYLAYGAFAGPGQTTASTRVFPSEPRADQARHRRPGRALMVADGDCAGLGLVRPSRRRRPAAWTRCAGVGLFGASILVTGVLVLARAALFVARSSPVPGSTTPPSGTPSSASAALPGSLQPRRRKAPSTPAGSDREPGGGRHKRRARVIAHAVSDERRAPGPAPTGGIPGHRRPIRSLGRGPGEASIRATGRPRGLPIPQAAAARREFGFER